jgi:hypothetical protein
MKSYYCQNKKCDTVDHVNIIIKFVVTMIKYLISILFCVTLLLLSNNNPEEHLVRFMSDVSVLQQGTAANMSFLDDSLSHSNRRADIESHFVLFDTGICGVFFPVYSYSRKIENPTVIKFISPKYFRLLTRNAGFNNKKSIADFSNFILFKSSYRFFVYALRQIQI